jgi:hypothetical protein
MKLARQILDLEQEIAQFCAQCQNTVLGVPMLVAKGSTLQCRLKNCNRKKVKAKIKQLKDLEKAKG